MDDPKKGHFLKPKKTTPSAILKYFSFAHLPEKLKQASQPFGELALKIEADLPDGPEKSTALRKLLEAKDCAVRAVL